MLWHSINGTLPVEIASLLFKLNITSNRRATAIEILKSRFSWKLREIRWPTFHICRSSFVTFFCTIKDERGVASEGLDDGSENSESATRSIGRPAANDWRKLGVWKHSTWSPACPSSTALRADFNTRMAVGLFLRISLHHLIVSCSSSSTWRRNRVRSLMNIY